MSVRAGIGIAALLLASAAIWELASSPRNPAPVAAAQEPARIGSEQAQPPASTALQPAPEPLPAQQPQRTTTRSTATALPRRGMWARLKQSVESYFVPASADADGDGRLDAVEREEARGLVQQRRDRAKPRN